MKAFVQWEKCKRGDWCYLSELDLAHSRFDDMEGVYLIWYVAEKTVCLRIGQGFIRDCLIQELYDDEIFAQRQRRELFVTWAEVGSTIRSSVAKYIIEELDPELECTCPESKPIEVNLPWDDATKLP